MQLIKKIGLNIVGWVAVVLGTIGMVLPIVPTTPFLILAAACFAKSSPRFHQWLLRNKIFGRLIRDWQDRRCIEQTTKKRAMVVSAITFAASIWLAPILWVKLLLVVIASVLFAFLWRLPTYNAEEAEVSNRGE